MADWLESILVWVQAHPLAAGIAVFASAVAESLFLFGLLVPGALLMFIAGALIGAGALPLLPTFAVAILGAIAGDSASFALGYAYRGNLHRIPLLKRAPRLIARGEDFLGRHGGKSIILGRFVGPLRPVMPTITGAAGMSVWRFLGIDIIAALGWAPCYILPGVIFGASLDLAAQVAGRLVLLLLVVVTTVWVIIWALRWLLAGGTVWGREYAQRLLSWSRRNRRLGLLGPALADPRAPETPALAVAAVLLMTFAWLAYGLNWGLDGQGYPLRIDALVYHLMQDLHTPWTDFIAQVFVQAGAPGIYLPLAGAIALSLLLLSGRRAALHWIAAVVFAGVLVLGLRWLIVVPTPIEYFQGRSPASGFPGGHIIVSAVIYGFLATILASRFNPSWRQIYYSGFTGLIVMIALARLYLGLDWLSDLAISALVALPWVGLLTLGFRRQRPRRLRHRFLLALVLAAFLAAFLAALGWQLARQTQGALPADAVTARVPVEDWQTRGYTRLPSYINDLVGRQSEPLNLQVSGELDVIVEKLRAVGWQPPVAATFAQTLRWLTATTNISELPVLPRIHDGRDPDLTLIRPINSHSQVILRLWRSHFENADNHESLWLGQVAWQSLTRRLEIIRMPADGRFYSAAVQTLSDSLPAHAVRMASIERRPGEWPGEILLWNTATGGGDTGKSNAARSNDRISADSPTRTQTNTP